MKYRIREHVNSHHPDRFFIQHRKWWCPFWSEMNRAGFRFLEDAEEWIQLITRKPKNVYHKVKING